MSFGFSSKIAILTFGLVKSVNRFSCARKMRKLTKKISIIVCDRIT